MRRRPVLLPLAVSVVLAGARPARADNTLHLGAAQLDLPTVISLGVQVMITGDDNFNAAVALRYRPTGTSAWRDAMPLVRVHPELVVGMSVPTQFAGSVFELAPDTAYDLELHATDPDGNVDQTLPLQARTRPVPKADPAHPHAVSVTDAASLSAALGGAKPGDVITLAKGMYPGLFSISASGTADDPIVIRGADRDGVVIDGQGCTGCNAFEVYASFVHLENLTIQHVERAVRWQTPGATDNVLRRVHATDLRLGVGGKTGQQGFYICDNVFEGRLTWPTTYGDDMQAHANDDGLVVQGSGHVVCHNTISGFADALQNADGGTRSNDFYGNDILWTYDDGIELDGMAGNGRCFRNRFMNTFDTLSFQPIYGGPVYAFRNVIVNVEGEGMKLHALGGNPPQEPVGVVVLHNTFVRPYHAIQLSTPNVVHAYVLENNLFVAPAAPSNGLTVMWDTPIDFQTGLVDYNGYWPEGKFEFGYGPTGATYASFAEMVAAKRYETHGVLLGASTFASGLMAPADHHPLAAPADAALASGSAAIDKGTIIPNVGDGFQGAAPDLGALEYGCAPPSYGPRPMGIDETNEPRGCEASPTTDGGMTTASVGAGTGANGAGGAHATSGSGGGGHPSGGTSAGCKCRSAGGEEEGSAGALAPLAAVAALAARRRRRR